MACGWASPARARDHQPRWSRKRRSSRRPAYGIRFPTEAEEELFKRFTVVLNHVDHLRLWLENEYGAAGQPLYEGLAAATVALPAFTRVKRRDVDVDAIRQNLSISWMSEPQLLLPSVLGAAELIRYSNAWARPSPPITAITMAAAVYRIKLAAGS